MTNEEKEYKRSFEEAQEFFNNYKNYNYQEVEDGLDKYANVPEALIEEVKKYNEFKAMDYNEAYDIVKNHTIN